MENMNGKQEEYRKKSITQDTNVKHGNTGKYHNRPDDLQKYIKAQDMYFDGTGKTVYEKALNLFITGEVSEVRVVYTEFESPIKQVPKYEVLLPVEKEGEQDILFDVEPNIEEVITNLLDIYLKGNGL